MQRVPARWARSSTTTLPSLVIKIFMSAMHRSFRRSPTQTPICRPPWWPSASGFGTAPRSAEAPANRPHALRRRAAAQR
ncbi:UNVERIFIED_CONTAM: hypothetical protein GTU68_063611 [Idotea baltica]|nr:hypothetical protein [Idotea baltica]